jgi:hypothetical protein
VSCARYLEDSSRGARTYTPSTSSPPTSILPTYCVVTTSSQKDQEKREADLQSVLDDPCCVHG